MLDNNVVSILLFLRHYCARRRLSLVVVLCKSINYRDNLTIARSENRGSSVTQKIHCVRKVIPCLVLFAEISSVCRRFCCCDFLDELFFNWVRIRVATLHDESVVRILLKLLSQIFRAKFSTTAFAFLSARVTCSPYHSM